MSVSISREMVGEPIATMRVYPDNPRGLYASVHVFASKRAMWRWAALNGTSGRFTGACQHFVKGRVHPDGRIETSREFAAVLLSRRWMGGEVVSHEFFHATMGWARRKRVPMTMVQGNPRDFGSYDMRVEEVLCYAHGRMVRQFVDRAHKMGLYR